MVYSSLVKNKNPKKADLSSFQKLKKYGIICNFVTKMKAQQNIKRAFFRRAHLAQRVPVYQAPEDFPPLFFFFSRSGLCYG